MFLIHFHFPILLILLEIASVMFQFQDPVEDGRHSRIQQRLHLNVLDSLSYPLGPFPFL